MPIQETSPKLFIALILDDHHLLQDTSVSLCTDYIILTEVISFYSHWFNELLTKDHYWTPVVPQNINEELADFYFSVSDW